LNGRAPEILRAWEVVETWTDAILAFAWRFDVAIIDGIAPEVLATEWEGLLARLLHSLQGFCSLAGAPEDLSRAARAAVKRALSMFDIIKRWDNLVEKFAVGQLDRDECCFLQRSFQSFTMHDRWLDVLCDPTAADAEQERASILDQIVTKVRTKFWSQELRQHVHSLILKADGVEDAVHAFKNSLPVEYSANDLPAIFDSIDADGLISKVSSSGDAKLCKQVSFILTHHRALKSVAELAQARGRPLGRIGGSLPLNSAHVKLVSKARMELGEAVLQAKNHGAQSLFTTHTDDDTEVHLAVLDGYITDTTAFAEKVKGVCSQEINLWLGLWSDTVLTNTETIEHSVPQGWQTTKETIMNAENAQVVKSLIGNADYLKLCQAVASLGEQLLDLKILATDSCGAYFTDPGLKKRSNKAIEDGTETVAVTYALYQLTILIPTLPQEQRKSAVQKCKADVAAKGAVLGQSLEDESIRLLG